MPLKNGRTSAALQQILVGSVIPPGTIQSFGGEIVPDGWLLCDGSTASRSTYSALFDAIGEAHGSGDGATTFHLPDLRGRFLRGADNMGTGAAGRDPDAASRTAANSGGATGNAVGSVQGHTNASHFHYTFNNTKITATNSSTLRLTASEYPAALDSSGVGYSSYNIDGNSTPATVGRNSDSGGNETRPQNANAAYIIKV